MTYDTYLAPLPNFTPEQLTEWESRATQLSRTAADEIQRANAETFAQFCRLTLAERHHPSR